LGTKLFLFLYNIKRECQKSAVFMESWLQMFFNDHNPLHFKAKFGEYEANITINDGAVLDGNLPSGKLKLVQAWAEIHQEELQAMWDSKEFHKIEPLQ
jgi:hypothetical protein